MAMTYAPHGARLPRNLSVEALRELYRIQRNQIIGDIYYVDAFNGNDDWDGLSPGSPLCTIAHALTHCANDHDDFIIIMNCWQQDTFPVAINKSMVHILGASHWGGMFQAMQPPTDTAVFTIDTKGYIEVGYLNLGAGDTHACIEFIGTVPEGRTWIHDVWMGHSYTARDGINIASTKEAPECMVERCVFGKILTRDGIRIEGQSTRTNIMNSIFRNVPGVGIHSLNELGLDIGAILGNRFSLLAQAAAGAAITIVSANAVGGPIDDNRAMEAGGNTANNPYSDAGACDWGVNWRGDVVTYPV